MHHLSQISRRDILHPKSTVAGFAEASRNKLASFLVVGGLATACAGPAFTSSNDAGTGDAGTDAGSAFTVLPDPSMLPPIPSVQDSGGSPSEEGMGGSAGIEGTAGAPNIVGIPENPPTIPVPTVTNSLDGGLMEEVGGAGGMTSSNGGSGGFGGSDAGINGGGRGGTMPMGGADAGRNDAGIPDAGADAGSDAGMGGGGGAGGNCPDMTRGEFIHALYEATDNDACPEGALSNCTDVLDANLSCEWNEVVSQDNLFVSSGESCRPDDAVLRHEVANSVMRVLGVNLVGTNAFHPRQGRERSFLDVTDAHQNYNAIEGLVEFDLAESGGVFNPDAAADVCFAQNVLQANSFSRPFGYVESLHEGPTELGQEQFRGRYYVYGTSAANPIQNVTVMNDSVGAFDAPESSSALSQFRITCGDLESWTLPAEADGRAEFTDLNCYQADGPLVITTYSRIASDASLGSQIRVGIEEGDLNLPGGQGMIPVVTVE